MVTTINNLGSASAFTYTELNGLGLNATSSLSAKNDSAIQKALAQEILKALPELRSQGVINPTWADIKSRIDYSKVFEDADALFAYPSTSTQTDKLQQIFLKVAGGNHHLNLGDWGNFAGKLQDDSARLQSALSVGQGGGIVHRNGHWYANGERVSLNQLNFTLRANQYSAIDTEIADHLSAIQQNNEKAKNAKGLQDVLSRLKADLDNGTLFHQQSDGAFLFSPLWDGPGTATATKYTGGTQYSDVWSALSSADIQKFAPKFYAAYGNNNGSITYTNIDDLISEVGTYLSANSTDNQVAQQRLERLNNQRIACLEGLTAFTKGQSDNFNQISRNL